MKVTQWLNKSNFKHLQFWRLQHLQVLELQHLLGLSICRCWSLQDLQVLEALTLRAPEFDWVTAGTTMEPTWNALDVQCKRAVVNRTVCVCAY